MKRMLVLSGLLVAAVAGCRGSSPAAGGNGLVPTPAPAPAQATTSSAGQPATVPAQAQATPSGSLPGSPAGMAKLTYTDRVGDSVTMTYSFSSPQPASRLPRVANASQGCVPERTGTATDLVIPFTVSATLNSSVSLDAGFSTTPAALAYSRYEVVYYTSGAYTCQDPVNNKGANVPFSLTHKGDSARTTAWLVLDGAISSGLPRGSQGRIGQMGLAPVLYQGNGLRLSSASGQAACTASSMQKTPVWLHVGGTFYASQQCGKPYTASAKQTR